MKHASRLAITLVAVLALGLLLSGFVVAQQDTTKTQERTTLQQPSRAGVQGPAKSRAEWRGRGFIDEDGNGICDRFEQGQAVGPKGNRGKGHGPNFIDEDGDGVCDHYAAGGRHVGRGHHGRGHGAKARGCGARR